MNGTTMRWIARFTAMTSCVLAIGGCASDDAANEQAASNQQSDNVALGMSPSHDGEGDVMVTFDECPAAVQDTITAHLNGGTLMRIERTTDHGEVLFEVDVEHGDGVVEFDVAEDGIFRGYEGADDDDSDDDDW